MINIHKSIRIDAPIDTVWAVTAMDFGGIYKWQAGVNHSTAEGINPDGAPCNERVCQVNVKGFSQTKERFVAYHPESYSFSYQVAEGLPGFVKDPINTWTHTPDGNGTIVTMAAEMDTRGLMGALMRPLMKRQMGNLLQEALEELKFYIEKGKPHPRKVAAMQKHAAKVPA